VRRDVRVERCACGAKLPAAEQVLARAYDQVELPPIKPVTARINRSTYGWCRINVPGPGHDRHAQPYRQAP
jgi:hypothetical protein